MRIAEHDSQLRRAFTLLRSASGLMAFPAATKVVAARFESVSKGSIAIAIDERVDASVRSCSVATRWDAPAVLVPDHDRY